MIVLKTFSADPNQAAAFKVNGYVVMFSFSQRGTSFEGGQPMSRSLMFQKKTNLEQESQKV